MDIKYTDHLTENMIPIEYETFYHWDAWAITYPLVEIRFDPEYFSTNEDFDLAEVIMTYSPYYGGLQNRIFVYYYTDNDFDTDLECEEIELTEKQAKEIESYINDTLADEDNSLKNLLNVAIMQYFDNAPGHYFEPISDAEIEKAYRYVIR